ncbi:hypothetical protein F0L68_29205 [Solihabitans fulvus]|uniref:Uncharacterized protein n=1 Tax=Solihabitans fulvus TaxID=1892852 RepID=A0A5B2WSA1_9PSEU|nr:hypothetical protein [Solihabitans fulvus]KAA2254863.1 hypothetical protein F0L68_29205 [Solihabitans fulvus]
MSGDDATGSTGPSLPSTTAEGGGESNPTTEKSTSGVLDSGTTKPPEPDEQKIYQQVRQNLDPAVSIHEGHWRDTVVGDQFNVFAGRGLPLLPGPVRAEVLEWIRERYAPVAGYDRMRETLAERRLVVLCGLPESGRATTALHLLDWSAAGKVSRLDSDEDLKSVQEKDFEREHGYLAELADTDAAPALAEKHLDRLSDLLRRRDSFCVLLSADGSQRELLGGYAVDCPPPEPDTLLARHVRAAVRDEEDDGLAERLLDLAAAPDVKAALGPAPVPRELIRLAGLLVDYGRGSITLEDVRDGCAQSVPRQVSVWFSGLREVGRGASADRALRLAGFRIALAFLNNSPVHLVREAGESLGEELMKTISPRRTPGRTLSADDADGGLLASRARIVDGGVSVGEASMPVEMIEFADDRFPQAVLAHVWLSHHNMREPLIRWIRQQSRHPSLMVWMRVALAAGLLCSLDFPYALNTLIEHEASALGKKKAKGQPRIAALMLDQAARDDRVRPVILELLRAWRRHGSEAKRRTVAGTLGYELGLESPDTTLEELRILGSTWELDRISSPERHLLLVWQCRRSLARLFCFGAAGTVLDHLLAWENAGRRSLRELVHGTILELCQLYVYHLWNNGTFAAAADRERLTLPSRRRHWPVLLALQDQDSTTTRPIASLLMSALRSSGSGGIEDVLGDWTRVGERDPECLDALCRFLSNLVENAGDRQRLHHIVNRIRRHWAEPLREEVAARLEMAIDGNPYQEQAS